jgi:hypothetical protein
MLMFVIVDEAHDEPQGRFQARPEAIAELRRRAPCLGKSYRGA